MRLPQLSLGSMKLSLRELLMLTAIVAMALGWWLDHRQLLAKYRAANDTAYSLQHVLTLDGWKLEWASDHSNLHGERATRRANDGTTSFDTGR